MKWYQSEDGSLKCFGHAEEYNLEHFHCAQLLDYGDCNRNLREDCWKKSNIGDFQVDDI